MHQTRLKYGAPQTLAINLASLATSGTVGRQSALVSNAIEGYADVLLELTVVLPTGTPVGEQAVFLWAAASLDGSLFTDNASGVEGSVTMRDPSNLVLVGRLDCPDAGGLTYRSPLWSLASVWQGVMPPFWSVVVRNITGLTLAAGSQVRYVPVSSELRRIA
ncbi:MAG TPA: hypothetical protein VGN57_08740 [Pirellulaceae bacterium]|nr:hypothetical protein [Pirellulaceae bacterium]